MVQKNRTMKAMSVLNKYHKTMCERLLKFSGFTSRLSVLIGGSLLLQGLRHHVSCKSSSKAPALSFATAAFRFSMNNTSSLARSRSSSLPRR